MADRANKVNLKEERARLTRVIKDSKARIEAEIKRYRTALANLKTAIREYEAVYTKYVAKPNPKMKEKLDAATEKLDLANSIRTQLRERIDTLVEIISRSTASIIDMVGTDSGQGKAEAKNLEKYMKSMSKRLSDLEGEIIDSLPDAVKKTEQESPALAEEELYDEEAVDIPALDREPTRAAATATSVNVSPVNIDVTPMVERAISAAIEQLSVGLGARIEAYIASVNIPAPAVTSAPVTPEARNNSVGAELEAHLLEGEAELYEKLKTMCVTLDELIAGVAEASGTYLTLMQKLKEISDMQKQVNEMQRQTYRDQQGVAVSQRLIADSQLEVVTAQKLVGDKQTELSDLTSKVTESQTAVLETEQAIVTSQMEIESSMRTLLDREKSIITAHQSLQDAAAKVETAQLAIQEKQAELLATQRETMTQQRQLQRELRSVAERQAASEAPKTPKRSRKKSTVDNTPETVVDGITVEKPTPEPEGPDLTVLAVD